jgi:Domain of unknown function (DUF4173)
VLLSLKSMSSQTRLGLALLASALFLGLLGDELLRVTPLGLNAFLWVAALCAVVVVLAQRLGTGPTGARLWMIPTLLLFSALLVWRDSAWLVALDLFAIVVALSLGALRTPRRVHQAGLTDYAVGLAHAGAAASGKAVTLMQEDIDWNELPKGEQSRQAFAVGRGLMLAAPLLFLFGALFVAADSVFQDYVRNAVPDPGDLVLHVALVALFAWVSAGLVREYLFKPKPIDAAVEPWFRLGATELTVVLALLDLLFLAFVLVQLRYLFGGASLVEARTQLTYAEYARHGFFELVTVAALVLPLLLLADWVRRRDPGSRDRLFQVLAGALILLLFVVMASALQRMRLYQREYGLTELRVYTTGVMLWLAVVFVWTGFTVLRGRRDLFAVGALVSGFAAIFAINVVNPDALIAQTNLNRPNLDLPYLMQLSDDATPELVKALPILEPRLRQQLAFELSHRKRSKSDWRTWNLSRHRAQQALDDLQ